MDARTRNKTRAQFHHRRCHAVFTQEVTCGLSKYGMHPITVGADAFGHAIHLSAPCERADRDAVDGSERLRIPTCVVTLELLKHHLANEQDPDDIPKRLKVGILALAAKRTLRAAEKAAAGEHRGEDCPEPKPGVWAQYNSYAIRLGKQATKFAGCALRTQIVTYYDGETEKHRRDRGVYRMFMLHGKNENRREIAKRNAAGVWTSIGVLQLRAMAELSYINRRDGHCDLCGRLYSAIGAHSKTMKHKNMFVARVKVALRRMNQMHAGDAPRRLPVPVQAPQESA